MLRDARHICRGALKVNRKETGMTVFNLLSVAFALIAAFLGSAKAFQMFQQNSYIASRYADWLKERFTTGRTVLKIAFAALFSALGFLWNGFGYVSAPILLIVAMVIFFSQRKGQKSAIKPLVLTARVKRMYVTESIIFAAVMGLCFADKFTPFCFAAAMLLFVFRELTVVLANVINKPIERAVAKHYINDAKKILKQTKGLITIGVTGSYGKTTTKFILSRILSEKYTVTVTPESFNTPMGIVRTVREKMVPGTEIFVAEMGAKNVGDIKEICDIVDPDMGLITSVGPQHLNTFGSIENIVGTKFELADAVAKKNGEIFLNGDNEYIRKKSGEYSRVHLYGTEKDCEAFAENITCSSSGSTFDIVFKDGRISVFTRLLGSHNVQNIVGAAAIARHLGVSDSDIKFAIGSLKATPHRLEMKSFAKGATLIDDAYNSNPKGCLEAVNVLSHFDGMKKIIVTPGLVELGEKEYECNFALGEAAGRVCDEIYLVGRMRSKPMTDALEKQGYDKDRIFVVSSFKEAMEKLIPTLDDSCVVLFENDLPDNYLK